MQQWNREKMIQWLTMQLSPQRLAHSLGVEATCQQLAEIHNVDVERAALAGLVHDCAKSMTDDQLIQAAQVYEIPYDKWMQCNTGLLHAPVGAALARQTFGIDEPSVLQAIRLHTLGGYDMTPLDMIVYLADMIEPTRSYRGVQVLRRQARVNLNSTLLTAIQQQFVFMSRMLETMHPDIVATWNGALARENNAKAP